MEMAYLISIPLYFLFWTSILKKYSFKECFLGIFHPLLAIFQIIFYPIFKKIILSFFEKKQNKKLYQELILLIELLKTQTKAGMLPGEAIRYLSQKRKWKTSIGKMIHQISGALSSGMGFQDAVQTYIQNHKNINRFVMLFLTSLLTGHASGGNLPDILEKLQNKLDLSMQLKRKSLVATAQMRMQSMVVTFSPLFIGLILYFIDEKNIVFFFENFTGFVLLMYMIVSNILGFFILRKVSTIKGVEE